MGEGRQLGVGRMGVVGGKREGGDGTTAEKGTGGWLENGIHTISPAFAFGKKKEKRNILPPCI